MAVLLFAIFTLSSALDMSIISYDDKNVVGESKSSWRTNEEVMSIYEGWLAKHGKAYNGLGEKDSDSRRHRSRFDREPSPKRSRRDGKDEKERVTSKINSESAKQSDQDQKHQPRLQDTLPLESPLATDSRVENGVSRKESDKKPGGHLEEAFNIGQMKTQ
ncbi:actinidain [Prunus persica]|uniref:actinidain n=1 Tax=Prunus persica TaxID=3760 RepID=UPI0009AB511F|nr:actinidain [Prunus persica]